MQTTSVPVYYSKRELVPTVFVPVQAAEHDLELFFMCTEILRELLKVQSSVMVGVPVLHNLEPDNKPYT